MGGDIVALQSGLINSPKNFDLSDYPNAFRKTVTQYWERINLSAYNYEIAYSKKTLLFLGIN